MLSCIVSGAVSASQFPRNHNASSMNRTVTDPQPLLFFAWLGLGLSSFLSSIVTLLPATGYPDRTRSHDSDGDGLDAFDDSRLVVLHLFRCWIPAHAGGDAQSACFPLVVTYPLRLSPDRNAHHGLCVFYRTL